MIAAASPVTTTTIAAETSPAVQAVAVILPAPATTMTSAEAAIPREEVMETRNATNAVALPATMTMAATADVDRRAEVIRRADAMTKTTTAAAVRRKGAAGMAIRAAIPRQPAKVGKTVVRREAATTR